MLNGYTTESEELPNGWCNGSIGSYCDVETANNAFMFLELKVCPPMSVDKLLQCLLQIVEYRSIRSLHLTMIDGDPRLQFLRLHRSEGKKGEECKQRIGNPTRFMMSVCHQQ